MSFRDAELTSAPRSTRSAGGLDVAEEAREPERLEAVLRPGVCERRILVEQLANPVGSADRGRLEHVEVRIGRQQLLDPSLIALVHGL